MKKSEEKTGVEKVTGEKVKAPKAEKAKKNVEASATKGKEVADKPKSRKSAEPPKY